MNIHQMLDRLAVKAGYIYGEKYKFFRNGMESPELGEVAQSLDMDFQPPDGVGEVVVPVRYKGEETAARYTVIHWAGAGFPSLLFHHGSGEPKYTALIRRVAGRLENRGVNIVAVSVPYNRSMREYLIGIAELERFCFMVASSARLFENLRICLTEGGSPKVTASGISLGGFITNLHFSLYGSMTVYRPIFAGAAMEHLFTETVFRRMTTADVWNHPQKLRLALNFEDAFRAGDSEKVYPLLGRWDQYVDLKRQGGIYKAQNIRMIEKGHITGGADLKSLRSFLFPPDPEDRRKP